jgi:7,8-dihydropterin-6-yl-methyl-4-(beta-D-ribofuranosyl)aminobenzene 5'-phosphate synthase
MRDRALIDAPDAQHGFSALVTVTYDGQRRSVLFDFGISPDGCAANLARLGHRSDEIDAVACSHGHFDHTAGLDALADELGQRHVPFVVHPDFWRERRLVIGETVIDLPAVDRATVTSAGFDVIERTEPTLLADGHVLLTGQIERHTEFEEGFPFQQARHGDEWEPDPDTLDDQALVVDVADHGLVVLTGCGHAGLINTIHHAQRLTGRNRIHTVMGGFHLTGPMFEPRIEPTLDALDEISPSVLVPTHCTGWKAIHAIARRFPNAFVQNSVGTSIEIGAPT